MNSKSCCNCKYCHSGYCKLRLRIICEHEALQCLDFQLPNSVTKLTNPKDGLGIRKVPIHAVPMQVMSEVGLAMMEGGRKYGTHNYRKDGVKVSTYIDAVWRHLFLQFWEGCDIDEDSGLHHITKAIASLIVLRDSMLFGNWIDDRPIRHSKDLTADFNAKAGDIINKYPDCKEPFLEK